jgi:hypothetical protein
MLSCICGELWIFSYHKPEADGGVYELLGHDVVECSEYLMIDYRENDAACPVIPIYHPVTDYLVEFRKTHSNWIELKCPVFRKGPSGLSFSEALLSKCLLRGLL